MSMNKLSGIVKGNGANIAKIVLGLVVAGAGLLGAVHSSDDGEKYIPGEIAESMEDTSEESSEAESAGEEAGE